MKKSWPILVFPLCVLLSFLAALTVYAKSSSLSTYYAAPNGNYNKLKLIPMGPSTVCNSANAGTLFIDNTTGTLNVCQYSNGKASMTAYPGACFNQFYTGTNPGCPTDKGFMAVNSSGNNLGSSFPASTETVNSVTCCYVGPSNPQASDTSNTTYAQAGCFMTFCSDSGGSSCPPTDCPAGTYQPTCLEMTATTAGVHVEKRTCCYGDPSLSVSDTSAVCSSATESMNCRPDHDEDCYPSSGNPNCMHCDDGVCRSLCGPGMKCYNDFCSNSDGQQYTCNPNDPGSCSDGDDANFTTCRYCDTSTHTCKSNCSAFQTCVAGSDKQSCQIVGCDPTKTQSQSGCSSGQTCEWRSGRGLGGQSGGICITTCTGDSDCNDEDLCTTDTCAPDIPHYPDIKICKHTKKPNCCYAKSGEEDDADCTAAAGRRCPFTNKCVNNTCQYIPGELNGVQCCTFDFQNTSCPCTNDRCEPPGPYCWHPSSQTCQH